MESFVLSETLKVVVCFSSLPILTVDVQYLFLLFDEENPLHSDDSNYVFTTEGHILSLGREHLKTLSSTHQNASSGGDRCLAYSSAKTTQKSLANKTGLIQGMRSHIDLDYSRELVALLPDGAEKDSWSPHGWCEKPEVDVPVGHSDPPLDSFSHRVSVVRVHSFTKWCNGGGGRQPRSR